MTRSYGLRVAVHGASVHPSLMRLLADASSMTERPFPRTTEPMAKAPARNFLPPTRLQIPLELQRGFLHGRCRAVCLNGQRCSLQPHRWIRGCADVVFTRTADALRMYTESLGSRHTRREIKIWTSESASSDCSKRAVPERVGRWTIKANARYVALYCSDSLREGRRMRWLASWGLAASGKVSLDARDRMPATISAGHPPRIEPCCPIGFRSKWLAIKRTSLRRTE